MGETMSLEGSEFIEDDYDIPLTYSAKKEESSSLEEINLVEEEQNGYKMETFDGDRIVVDTESSEGDAPLPVEMYIVNNENDIVIMKHSPTSGLGLTEGSYLEEDSPCMIDTDPLSIRSPMSQLPAPEADPLFSVPTKPLTSIPVADSVPMIKPPMSVPPAPEEVISDSSDESTYKQEDHDYMLPDWYVPVKQTPSPPLVPCTCCVSKRSINSILGHGKADLFSMFHKRYFCTCGAATEGSQRYKDSLPKVHQLIKQLWTSEPMDMVKMVIFLVAQMQPSARTKPNRTNKNSSFRDNSAEQVTPRSFRDQSPHWRATHKPVEVENETPLLEEDSSVFMVLRDVLTNKLYNLEEHNHSFRLTDRNEEAPPFIKRSGPEMPINLDIEEEVQMKRPKVIEPTTVLRKFPGRKRKRGRRPKATVDQSATPDTNLTPNTNMTHDTDEILDSEPSMESFFGACDGLIESMMTRSVVKNPAEYVRRKSAVKVDYRTNLRGFAFFDIKRSAKKLQEFRFLYPYDEEFDLCHGYTSGEVYLAKDTFSEFESNFRGYSKSLSPSHKK